jgi:hypothetical protein
MAISTRRQFCPVVLACGLYFVFIYCLHKYCMSFCCHELVMKVDFPFVLAHKVLCAKWILMLRSEARGGARVSSEGRGAQKEDREVGA